MLKPEEMGRPPCCDKASVKKGPWTEEEDLKLIAYTNSHGTGNWTSVPKKAGLKRCGKSCRLRWTNYLRPNLKHESFTQQEEEMIITLHATIGSRWSAIAHHLPGRTDNDIKNYWNTKLSKKLVEKGIDPITHHPLSQVIESIANIQTAQICNQTTPHSGRGIGYLNRSLKNVSTWKPATLEPFCGSSSNEGSSSSTAATAHAAGDPSLDLDWTDYLVEDAFVPDERSWNVEASAVPSTVKHCSAMEDDVNSMFGAPYSSDSTSFVDAILDQEKEMRSDFPEFLDDSYN